LAASYISATDPFGAVIEEEPETIDAFYAPYARQRVRALGEGKMYEVVASLVGLALLVAVLLFDCRVCIEATKSAENLHFSARPLQQACAALRRCVSLLSIRRSGAVEPSRHQRGIGTVFCTLACPNQSCITRTSSRWLAM
jgi:hypothetical protein